MVPILLNQLGSVDRLFFISLLVIVLLAVGIYFLIPILNKKQYQQQRENLKKREESFSANLRAKEEKVIKVEAEEKIENE